jgi:hypothetical protein
VRRAREHDVEALRGDAQGLDLGGVLGVRVRDPERPRAHVALVERAASPRRPDRRHRRHVHDPLHPLGEARLEHRARAVHVDPHEVGRRQAQARGAGRVEGALDPARGPAHRPAVGGVGGHALHVQAVEGIRRRAGAHGHPHVVSAREQRAHEVGADEARRTGDQHPSHGARIGCPPCPVSQW